MGAGAGKHVHRRGAHGELLLRSASSVDNENSAYLAERAQKRWKSKGDGVLWGKLSSLDRDEIGDIYLQGDVFSIGRDGVLCTYQVVNKLVSSYHVELKVENYGKSVRVIFVHDHSTNGTFLDGQRVGAGNKTVLNEGAKLSLPWFSRGEEKVVSFRYEPIKVVSDDWEPILEKYTFGTITFEGTFTTYQLLSPKTPAGPGGGDGSGGDAGAETADAANAGAGEVLTAKIINMEQMQLAFSSKKAADMVRKEVDILGHLQHPNIAPLRDSFLGTEYSFLVFKYPQLSPSRAYDLSELVQVQWDAASQLVRERRGGPKAEPGLALLSEELARDLMRQLVEVVAYIHSQDISHRNISPENCLLEYSDELGGGGGAMGVTLKLSNFGFASSFKDNAAMQTKIETGHIDFCAPEMILQENGYGKEVDLWSVGVLAMMLLGGGRAPFRKESLSDSSAGAATAGGSSDDGGGGGEGGGGGIGGGGPGGGLRVSGPASSVSSHAGDESGLSTAAVIENITQAKFDFVPEEIWNQGERSEECRRFVQALLVADPAQRASAAALLGGKGSTWLSDPTAASAPTTAAPP